MSSKKATVTTATEEENAVNILLKQFFLESVMTPDALSLPGNGWLQTPEMMPTAMLYANGRFQGLVHGLSASEGFGGHPGLLYKLLVCALSYGIPCIGISVSGTVDDIKNPLTYNEKIPIMRNIFQQLNDATVSNIISFARKKGIEIDQLEEEIQERLTGIHIEFQQLSNPFATVLEFKRRFNELGVEIDILIMASGLELSKTKGEYNKYEHTFDKLVGSEEEKPFHSIYFILTSRETHDTISGTKIRELILNNEYEQLAQYLLEAGFTTDQLIRDYGSLIPSVKKGLKAQLSQEPDEYSITLQDWMMTHAFNDLSELDELREKEPLTQEEAERLSELETREGFLLDFTGQTTSASAGGRKRKEMGKGTRRRTRGTRKERKVRKNTQKRDKKRRRSRNNIKRV